MIIMIMTPRAEQQHLVQSAQGRRTSGRERRETSKSNIPSSQTDVWRRSMDGAAERRSRRRSLLLPLRVYAYVRIQAATVCV